MLEFIFRKALVLFLQEFWEWWLTHLICDDSLDLKMPVSVSICEGNAWTHTHTDTDKGLCCFPPQQSSRRLRYQEVLHLTEERVRDHSTLARLCALKQWLREDEEQQQNSYPESPRVSLLSGKMKFFYFQLSFSLFDDWRCDRMGSRERHSFTIRQHLSKSPQRLAVS